MTAARILVFVPATARVALWSGANSLPALTDATRVGWHRAVRALPGRCGGVARGPRPDGAPAARTNRASGGLAIGAAALLARSERAAR